MGKTVTDRKRTNEEVFLGEVAVIINKLSLDTIAHIPDFIIASHLWASYQALKNTDFENRNWHRVDPQ